MTNEERRAIAAAVSEQLQQFAADQNAKRKAAEASVAELLDSFEREQRKAIDAAIDARLQARSALRAPPRASNAASVDFDPTAGTSNSRIDELTAEVVRAMKGFVGRSVAPLIERISALESRPFIVDAGVFRADSAYKAGDAVTWDGCLWIAQRSIAGERPGDDSGAFRLSVKKGRDAGRSRKIGEFA